MAFYDEEHKKRIKKILELWDRINELTELAATNGIKDIFQDNISASPALTFTHK